jgi:HPt (histidine-containing phosphotransfer) domain-containing protein
MMAELHQAVSQRNAERLWQVAHTLKGTLGNLSAAAAREVVLRLEERGRGGDLAGVDDDFALLQEQIRRLEAALVRFEADLSA